MSEIWKFELTQQYTPITMPKDSKVVHVDEQHGNVCLWVHVNPENSTVRRAFYIAVTGQEIEPELVYVGTVLLNDGNYVVHVFEDTKSEIINDQG